jgi:hypothetical protein
VLVEEGDVANGAVNSGAASDQWARKCTWNKTLLLEAIGAGKDTIRSRSSIMVQSALKS